MSKLYAKITNEAGKTASKTGKDYLDIDVLVGHHRLASFTLRRGEIPEENEEGWILYDTDNQPIYWIENNKQGKALQESKKRKDTAHERKV